MDLLKEIGAILGFVAFGGLAILAFLTFQQARHLRRLRDWAGREPERAAAEEERVSAAAEEATAIRREDAASDEREPSRIDKLRGEASARMEDMGRRSPVDPKIILGGLLAVLIGVAVATSGFGLIGGDDGDASSTTDSSAPKEDEVKVAVLNGTAPAEGEAAVEGAADRASKLVEAAGYKVGAVETAPGSFPASVVMFPEGSKSEATDLAADLEDALGPTEIEPITPEIQDVAGKADVALVVGADDGQI